ncbi:hypothetical protein [Streptomyces sp. CB03238]|uniref:hypothetical protein n=1 Tax=Streptomyces sp. CB03238 TaxID=1907777 RepID=UPI0015C470E6|nr:hypothetical protein [Streptomyces sp. CB03238]
MSAPQESYADRAARLPFVARPTADPKVSIVVIEEETEDGNVNQAVEVHVDGEPE